MRHKRHICPCPACRRERLLRRARFALIFAVLVILAALGISAIWKG
jgi:hypothetical protein